MGRTQCQSRGRGWSDQRKRWRCVEQVPGGDEQAKSRVCEEWPAMARRCGLHFLQKVEERSKDDRCLFPSWERGITRGVLHLIFGWVRKMVGVPLPDSFTQSHSQSSKSTPCSMLFPWWGVVPLVYPLFITLSHFELMALYLQGKCHLLLTRPVI